MVARVLIIGAYGNFGGRITRALAADKNIKVLIAGRSEEKCAALARELQSSPNLPLFHTLDITKNLPEVLAQLKPDITIHTSGPYQGQGYEVAEACIKAGSHYIDLADGRDFVSGIERLNAAAIAANVSVITGASSVPCLSAAVIDHYLPAFKVIDTADYGISTAKAQNLGLAAARGVLSYAGRKMPSLKDGVAGEVYGWQDVRFHNFPTLGFRALSNCDVPDLALFPKHYPSLKNLRFGAGLEFGWMQAGLSFAAFLARFGILKSVESYAPLLLKIAAPFDRFSSGQSGFFMKLSGLGHDGNAKALTFYLLAENNDGAYVPCMPAVICAQKLASAAKPPAGAYPCMGIIGLKDYLASLSTRSITYAEEG